MWQVLFAGALFVGTHLGISSTPLRPALVSRLGERGFLALYSVLALATISYLVWLYGEVPRYEYLWLPDPALYWVAKLIMPVAFVFLVGGFMVPNPTAVGMDRELRDPERRAAAARGLLRITRHPFQWAVILWAGSHIVANGDVVSVAFFGTFLTLSATGTVLMDRKKAAALGGDWEPFANATSNVPFAAILGGRNRLVPAELVAPAVVGLAFYGLVYWGHEWVAGVRLM